MPRFQFEREFRTPSSESFVVLAEDKAIGRVDVHFAADVCNATICVPEGFSEGDIHDLIGEIDERLVMSANPFREDFVVTVWIGRHAGVYSEETDEELAEEMNDGNRLAN